MPFNCCLSPPKKHADNGTRMRPPVGTFPAQRETSHTPPEPSASVSAGTRPAYGAGGRAIASDPTGCFGRGGDVGSLDGLALVFLQKRWFEFFPLSCPAGKSPANQEGLHHPTGTGSLFCPGIFSWKEAEYRQERAQPLLESYQCGRRSSPPPALPHSPRLAWRAILSPTCGCLCDFPGKAASLTSARNSKLLEILGAGRHRSPPHYPSTGDGEQQLGPT